MIPDVLRAKFYSRPRTQALKMLSLHIRFFSVISREDMQLHSRNLGAIFCRHSRKPNGANELTVATVWPSATDRQSIFPGVRAERCGWRADRQIASATQLLAEECKCKSFRLCIYVDDYNAQ
jgi:hypothetical protein